jgi:hypothetical protein
MLFALRCIFRYPATGKIVDKKEGKKERKKKRKTKTRSCCVLFDTFEILESVL